MTDNIERLNNRIDEYCEVFKNSVIPEHAGIVETDEAMQIYVRNANSFDVDFRMYAMIDLDIDKRLEVYEEMLGMTPIGGIAFECNELPYSLRWIDYRDTVCSHLNFFRSLYYAKLLNRPGLYKKILERGGENNFEKLKTLLTVGGSYINNVECRAVLLEYINKHDEKKEDIEL